MSLLFKSDYAKIHQRAREINKQYHQRDGVGSYESAYQKALADYCKEKKI